MASVIDTHSSLMSQLDLPPDLLQAITSVPVSKLNAPPLSASLLERASLLQLLVQASGQRLIAISAAAGYGKSTLAALWLRDAARSEQPIFTAWLSLDTDDDEPLRFLICLAAALAPIVPEAAGVATTVALHHSPRQALRLLLDGLGNTPGPIRLVIDDLHRLSNPDAIDLLATALERSPANLHWMLLSRHTMPFPLGKLRLQGQVLELDSRDLQLPRSEIEQLLALNSALNWKSHDVDLLAERTQGWITGIHLTLLSLNRHTPAGRHSPRGATEQTNPVNDLLAHLRGDNALLASYLTGELLNHQSEQMRSFLLQCSIVERLHADLCNAIMGEGNSAQLLQQAADAQLFLQPLDTYGEWYAFHQLFREMLLRHLRRQLAASQVQELHRRAAAWLLRQGDMPASLNTLLAGGDRELAAELVQSRSRTALLQNNSAELHQWARLLPTEQIDARPQLLIDLAWLYSGSDQKTFASLLARARASVAVLSTLPPEWRDELAALALLDRLMSADQSGLYTDCLAALQLMDARSHFAAGWSHMVASLTGVYQSPGATADDHLQAAGAAFASAGYAPGEITVLARQAQLHMSHGAAEAALDACRQGLQLFERQERPPGDAGMFFAFLAGEVSYWRNQIEQAAAWFQRAQSYARRYGEATHLLLTTAALQLCDLASGRPVILSQAMLDAEEAAWQEVAAIKAVGSVGHIVQWQMARWLALGKPEQAWRAFRRMELSLESLAANAAENAWLALLTAYVIHGRDLEKLTPLLEVQLRQAQAANSQHMIIRLQLLIASQQQQLGNHTAVRRVLRQALHNVEYTGYIRMLLQHPELGPGLRVLNTAYTQQVLTLLDKAPGAYMRPRELTDQEATILTLLSKGYSNSEIAERLVLAESTVKWHLGNIYKKLGVKGRREAVALARSLNP